MNFFIQPCSLSSLQMSMQWKSQITSWHYHENSFDFVDSTSISDHNLIIMLMSKGTTGNTKISYNFSSFYVDMSKSTGCILLFFKINQHYLFLVKVFPTSKWFYTSWESSNNIQYLNPRKHLSSSMQFSCTLDSVELYVHVPCLLSLKV